MKKLFALLTLLAVLLSLASCAASLAPSATSKSPPASSPESTPPASTTPPPKTSIPDGLTEDEQIDRLASLLDTAEKGRSLALSGSAELVYSDGSKCAFAVSGCVFLADPCAASIRFTSETPQVLGGELYLKDRVLCLMRESEDGVPSLLYPLELDSYRTLCERAEQTALRLLEVRELLTERAAELDALLALLEKKLSSQELISLVSLLGKYTADAVKALGIELAADLGDEVSVRDAAKALYALCAEPSGAGETSLTLTPARILSLLSSLFDELDARLDVTVSAILDEFLGQGQTSELYRRLAAFSGESTLSAWRAEVESILISEGISPSLFYELLASILDRTMSAEMTPDRLRKLLDENAERSLDRVIDLFWDDRTYSGLMRDLHSILTMPPTSLYTAFGGVGELGDRLREARARFDGFADAFDLSVVLDLNGAAISSAELMLSLDLTAPAGSEKPHCTGISLAVALEASDREPTPSEQMKNHPDFVGH